MDGELMISELAIAIEEETGRRYLYGSLFDFYAETKEELDGLTDVMMNHYRQI